MEKREISCHELWNFIHDDEKSREALYEYIQSRIQREIEARQERAEYARFHVGQPEKACTSCDFTRFAESRARRYNRLHANTIARMKAIRGAAFYLMVNYQDIVLHAVNAQNYKEVCNE